MSQFEPAGEVEKVVGVDAKRTQGKLTEALSVEEGIRPLDLFSLLVAHTIRGSAGGSSRLIDHGEIHVRPQPHFSSNCLSLSRSEAAWPSACLRSRGREELDRKAWSGGGGEQPGAFAGERAGRSSTWQIPPS